LCRWIKVSSFKSFLAGLNVPTGASVKRKSVGDLAKGFEQKGGIRI
jgi:hypothetical protein